MGSRRRPRASSSTMAPSPPEYGIALEGSDYIAHMYHIASETSSVDDDTWVLAGDTAILVSVTAAIPNVVLTCDRP